MDRVKIISNLFFNMFFVMSCVSVLGLMTRFPLNVIFKYPHPGFFFILIINPVLF